MFTVWSGRRVRSDYHTVVGTISFVEDGIVWAVWPPHEDSARYSAAGLPYDRLDPVDPEPEQLLLISRHTPKKRSRLVS